MAADERVTITITTGALEAAINCLGACADDEREPQRYRDWYAEAQAELKTAR